MSGSTQPLPDGGPRLKALRAAFEYPTAAAAAEALAFPISAWRWKEIESPNLPAWLTVAEAERIAAAQGLHLDWFTAPLEHLGDLGEPPRRG